MCLLDYNKKVKKYKHITYAERTMIETWYNCDKKNKREIAEKEIQLQTPFVRRGNA